MPDKIRNSSLLEYFQIYLRRGSPLQRLVFVAYFAIMLIVPLFRVTSTSVDFAGNGGFVVLAVLAVQALFVFGVHNFNRTCTEECRPIGKKTFWMVVLPVILLAISSFITLVLHDQVPGWFTQMLISVSIVIPLGFVILILAESIFQVRSDKSLLIPFLMILVTDFLIIYIFGAIYFINGLVVTTAGDPGGFGDALYVSGQAFTTLGFSTAQPTGIGQVLVIFEALAGFLILSLLTALFLQTIFSRRQPADR
jgi:hypothetical protein